ncbi:MAG: glycosyltransferase family 4 protein [Planctomycetes bacterium]|nr:glycosyltransferase family 4 protein [Planctomycetota bacterium]
MPVLTVAIDYRPAVLTRAGIGRAVRHLAAALAARDDVELHLFAHSLARAVVPLSPPPRAHLHRLPIAGRALPSLAALGLGAERLAGRATVFHWTDYIHPPVGRARAVLTVHDLAFVRDPTWHGADAPVLRQRTATAIAAARRVIAPSQATAADLRAFAPGAEISVIPFGADHVPAAPPAPALPPFALALGTIEPRKNHRALLAAWRLLPAPRPLLLVVGRPGWEHDGIAAELLAAEREGWLRWLRTADDATVFALLAHAQMLVYPSLWEGFGFPPLEAMALHTPVLLHDCAPLRELADDAASFCDATEPAALADAISRLLADEALRTRLRERGARRAAGFSWAACAAAHARVYGEAVA